MPKELFKEYQETKDHTILQVCCDILEESGDTILQRISKIGFQCEYDVKVLENVFGIYVMDIEIQTTENWKGKIVRNHPIHKIEGNFLPFAHFTGYKYRNGKHQIIENAKAPASIVGNGYIYAPYIPLQSTEDVNSIDTFVLYSFDEDGGKFRIAEGLGMSYDDRCRDLNKFNITNAKSIEVILDNWYRVAKNNSDPNYQYYFKRFNSRLLSEILERE